MTIVGLTGGIASGKSLVAGVFRGLGAYVIDADRIVHELLEPGRESWREILAYFGESIALPDKTINRRRLGEIVFSDPEKRAWLNRCLHPRVFEVYAAQVRHLCERHPDAVVVFDAALLIETGYYKKMDKVVVVYADEEHQLKRLMEREHFTREQAMMRIRSQMPLAEKRRLADYVIDNRGARMDTERQAALVFAELKRAAEKTG